MLDTVIKIKNKIDSQIFQLNEIRYLNDITTSLLQNRNSIENNRVNNFENLNSINYSNLNFYKKHHSIEFLVPFNFITNPSVIKNIENKLTELGIPFERIEITENTESENQFTKLYTISILSSHNISTYTFSIDPQIVKNTFFLNSSGIGKYEINLPLSIYNKNLESRKLNKVLSTILSSNELKMKIPTRFSNFSLEHTSILDGFRIFNISKTKNDYKLLNPSSHLSLKVSPGVIKVLLSSEIKKLGIKERFNLDSVSVTDHTSIERYGIAYNILLSSKIRKCESGWVLGAKITKCGNLHLKFKIKYIFSLTDSFGKLVYNLRKISFTDNSYFDIDHCGDLVDWICDDVEDVLNNVLRSYTSKIGQDIPTNISNTLTLDNFEIEDLQYNYNQGCYTLKFKK